MEVINQLQKIVPRGVNAFLVGGCVRDLILNKEPKDIDVEVFGLSVDQIEEFLKPHGKVVPAGKKFGALKLFTDFGEFDFTAPRRDNKCGVGHKDFRVEIDPSMTIEEAARRRDFTINTMSINIWTAELIDPYGGRHDLQNRILRHVSQQFGEDPLRVLRGFQFVSRYNLDADRSTIELCRSLLDEFKFLSKERVWEEFKKWATKSTTPSKGLKFLLDTHWIYLFPEIGRLIGCQQDPEWHPEGDVFLHTCETVDKAVGSNLVVMLSALCHDFGKPDVTEFIDGRIRSPGHTSSGVEITKSFLDRIGCPNDISKQVQSLVKEHMVHLQDVSKRNVRRLILRLGDASIEDLVSLIGVDHSGRGSASISWPESVIQIKDIAEDIGNEIKPILMGRHLINLGMKPGPEFGSILRAAFEAQLDGKFDSVEDGIEYLKQERLI